MKVREDLEGSRLDQRRYCGLVLDNDLHVVLVSDVLAAKAAASMTVHVGHFSDPDEVPGMAHFLEHMLFLGTEKYPQEDAYRKYLSSNGGTCNASTAMEETEFHFSVVADKLWGALEIFAAFFTCPLFTESATEREMNAVESEHQKNLQSDTHRVYQLIKSICKEAGSSHPFCKFGTGNLATLSVPDIRLKLMDFHRSYYSSNNMSLCIVGPQSLDELAAKVEELFSEIPNREIPHPSFSYSSEKLYQKWANQATKISVESIKDLRQLSLRWIIQPSLREQYRSKPSYYVSHLVGHEGKGSLLSALKTKGWATSLSAGPCLETTSFDTFDVVIDLTEEGVQHEDEIIAMVFDYLRLIQKEGIQEWIYTEIKTVADTEFRFLEREDPVKLARRLSPVPLKFQMNHWLSGQYLYFDFDPTAISAFLGQLQPTGLQIMTLFGSQTAHLSYREAWYGTPYGLEVIPEECLGKWMVSENPAGLKLPQPNLFLPTDFQLLSETGVAPNASVPSLILEEEGLSLHYLLDSEFPIPKAAVFALLQSGELYWSPRNVAMGILLVELLRDSLTEYVYDAEQAGFKFALDSHASGLQLTLSGFSDKLIDLLLAILQKIRTAEFQVDRFLSLRDLVRRDSLNFFLEQPYQLAMYEYILLVEVPRWHMRRIADEVADIELNDVVRFSQRFFSRLHVEVLVHGNLSPEGAHLVGKSLRTVLQYQALDRSEKFVRRIVQIPTHAQGFTLVRENTNPDNSNSAIYLSFQLGVLTLEETISLEILAKILEKRFFQSLRTEQQLGYVVASSASHNMNVSSLAFVIQSAVHLPSYLDARIEEYLMSFRNELEELAEEEFAGYVWALKAVKLEKDKFLFQKTSRLWAEVVKQRFLFDKRDLEARILDGDLMELRHAVVRMYEERISSQGSSRRKVAVHMSKSRETLDHPFHEIGDAVDFQRRQSLYTAQYYTPYLSDRLP